MFGRPVVLIGVGEMGGVFARGLLRNGHPVFPVTRNMDVAQSAAALPAPELALVTVAENDLQLVLQTLPQPWRDRVGLLQNELLPRDWQTHGLTPTITVVWFEKKKGQDHKVIIPSPVFGPNAELIVQALESLGIPTRTLTSGNELLFELVRKNLYILTSNIAGIIAGGTVGALWQQHQPLARKVAEDVLTIQDWLAGTQFSHDTLIEGMVEAFEADPEHPCTGRSAPARLVRALGHADEAGLPVPQLRRIAARQ